MRSVRNTKIRKMPYFEVYPDIFITDMKNNTGIFEFLLLKYPYAHFGCMKNRKYVFVLGPEGLKLIETARTYLKSIFDFLNITDFKVITDI